jgi:hypothetical protein
MDERLELLSETVRDREYRELFPDTLVNLCKEDEAKVREALFQVQYMVYSPELKDLAVNHDSNEIEMGVVLDTCRDVIMQKRLKDLLGGQIYETEDGREAVLKKDLMSALRPEGSTVR